MDNPRGGGRILTHMQAQPFLGSKILNFYILGGFQKKIIFLGYEYFLGYFFGVITKLD